MAAFGGGVAGCEGFGEGAVEALAGGVGERSRALSRLGAVALGTSPAGGRSGVGRGDDGRGGRGGHDGEGGGRGVAGAGLGGLAAAEGDQGDDGGEGEADCGDDEPHGGLAAEVGREGGLEGAGAVGARGHRRHGGGVEEAGVELLHVGRGRGGRGGERGKDGGEAGDRAGAGAQADVEGEGEGLGEVLRGLEALVDVAVDGAGPPGVEAVGEAALRGDLRGDRDGVDHDLHDELGQGVAAEGELADEALVDDDRERPEVGAVVDGLLGAEVLGAHVERRAEDHAGRGVGLGERGAGRRLRDAEVEHLRDLALVIAGEEDVGGLEVAVDEAGGVRHGEGAADLRGDRGDLARREGALAAEAAVQVLPLEQLHRDVGDAAPHAVVEDLHDVGAPELGRGLGLALEAPRDLGRARGGRVHELERARRLELRVLRGPDGAHAPLAEGADEPEAVGDHEPRLERHLRGGRGRFAELRGQLAVGLDVRRWRRLAGHDRRAYPKIQGEGSGKGAGGACSLRLTSARASSPRSRP